MNQRFTCGLLSICLIFIISIELANTQDGIIGAGAGAGAGGAILGFALGFAAARIFDDDDDSSTTLRNCPPSYTHENSATNRCYRLATAVMKLPNAIHDCAKDGGYLAEITNIAEYNYLKTVLMAATHPLAAGTNDYLIAMFNEAAQLRRGLFTATDPALTTTEAPDAGFMTAANQCVVFDESGSWVLIDADCATIDTLYICEFNRGSTAAVTNCIN